MQQNFEPAFATLGLNAYETKIYLALLDNPRSTAAEIAKHSGVPQNRVYDVMEALINRKLAYLIPESPKRYSPEDPQHLQSIVQEKLGQLKEFEKEIGDLGKKFQEAPRQQVLVSRNARNFDKIMESLPPAKVFERSIKAKLSTRPQYLKKIERHMRSKFDYKSLTDKRYDGSRELRAWRKVYPGFKLIDAGGVILNVTEKGTLISLAPPENESLIIYIENAHLSLILKDMFDAYYERLPQ